MISISSIFSAPTFHTSTTIQTDRLVVRVGAGLWLDAGLNQQDGVSHLCGDLCNLIGIQFYVCFNSMWFANHLLYFEHLCMHLQISMTVYRQLGTIQICLKVSFTYIYSGTIINFDL